MPSAFNKMEFNCINHYDTGSTTPQMIASSTCTLATSTAAIATTSDIVLVPTLTAGEVLVALFLFVLILIALGKGVLAALDRIVTKKKIIAYSGGDVEIRNDI